MTKVKGWVACGGPHSTELEEVTLLGSPHLGFYKAANGAVFIVRRDCERTALWRALESTEEGYHLEALDCFTALRECLREHMDDQREEAELEKVFSSSDHADPRSLWQPTNVFDDARMEAQLTTLLTNTAPTAQITRLMRKDSDYGWIYKVVAHVEDGRDFELRWEETENGGSWRRKD